MRRNGLLVGPGLAEPAAYAGPGPAAAAATATGGQAPAEYGQANGEDQPRCRDDQVIAAHMPSCGARSFPAIRPAAGGSGVQSVW